jgi:RNA-binding protein YhbY
VIAEIGRALEAHELIKVRAGGMERDEREAALAEICTRLDAQAVQHIGKVLVVYRKKPDSA